MTRALYDIWEEANADAQSNTRFLCVSKLWRAQLVNYVGQFETQDAAESFVETVKDYRKKNGLK